MSDVFNLLNSEDKEEIKKAMKALIVKQMARDIKDSSYNLLDIDAVRDIINEAIVELVEEIKEDVKDKLREKFEKELEAKFNQL